ASAAPVCSVTPFEGPVLASAFFFSSRRRHTRSKRDWSSDVCSSDLVFYASLMQALDEFFPYVRRLCWCNGKVYNFFVSFFRNTNSYIYSFFFNRLTSNWNMSGIQVNAHIAFF